MKVALVDVARTGNPTAMCPGHYRDYVGHLGGQASAGRVMFGEGECKGCKNNGPHPQRDLGWTQDQVQQPQGARRTAVRKQAHDSGDGATIFHCPFCGSGQVIARSDRTTECEYCHACFTVQVQPQFPAFPQTIDGMPMQVPGMPGQVGGPPAAPDAMGDPMGGVDPAEALGGDVPPGGDAEAPEDGEDAEDDEDGGDAPPWAKNSMLRTASGTSLDYENYLRHLAIRFADKDDKDTVIERVRGGRS